MRLAYFDEAGIGDERYEPLTVTACIVINADYDWRSIEKYLAALVEAHVPLASRSEFEFHATELFNGGKATKDWGKELRWKILGEFLRTFDRFDLPIIWSSAVRAFFAKNSALANVQAKHPGRAVAFAACLQLLNVWMVRTYPLEVAICIYDDPGADKAILEQIYRGFRSLKEIIVGVPLFGPLTSLIDELSFRSSRRSFGAHATFSSSATS